MRLPRETPDPSADPHPGKRGRSGVGSLVIMLAIAAIVLVGFLLWNNSGWQSAPDEAVTAEGEPAETEAPSGTEPPEPAVPEAASPDAPVETDPPAEEAQQ